MKKIKASTEEKKPFYKKWWFIAIVIFFVVGIVGSATGVLTVEDDAPAQEKSEEVKAPKTTEKTNYMTEAAWSLDDNYVFAVEVKDYDGDIFQAGNYHFSMGNISSIEKGEMLSDKTQGVWDIYVSDNLYPHTTDLKKSEYVTSIGGVDQDDDNIELKKGQYVYVKTMDVVNERIGDLEIKINK